MKSNLERNTTIPFAWYSDPSILAREQERIFRRRWQYVGHAGQVSQPGSLANARAGDIPVLLVRDLDGDLRAFLNVCRHRGTQVVDNDCKGSIIQCPYHAWTYDLDGHLRSAPRSNANAEFNREDLGLIPLSTGSWGPFIFINPDPDAAPLSETLGRLPGLVASVGVDVDALEFHQRSVSNYAANWKICCENFLECYHCQIAHPGLAKVIDVSAGAYRLEEDRWFSSQFGPVKEAWTGNFDPSGAIPQGQFHLLYPNVTINIAPGCPNISIGPVLPDGPNHTTRFLDYFFAPETDPAWIRDLLAWDDGVGVEDTALVERVQRGVGSGMLERGVLLDDERLIAHFNQLLLQDLV